MVVVLLCLCQTVVYGQERGMASYYANRLHGRKMSNGVPYHRDSLTCAHRTLPLGTVLKVTNVKNGRSVVVTVTDRCAGSRIVDLSYAAAQELGMIAAGVTMVQVERYTPPVEIPYRLEDVFDLPEYDFEINDFGDLLTSPWYEDRDEDGERH